MNLAASDNASLIQALINQGVNLIPVRDKYENGLKAKTPYKEWKKYQSELLSFKELYNKMYFYDTRAVAAVCGKISGNLEVIDIDTKYKAGFDAVIFSSLQTIYPDLFSKLRIHKTPSGGYHILYKVTDHDLPASSNLAERPATETELANNPKREKYCFVESKAEGGLSQMPPSTGYSIFQDNPIPFITWSQRCSVINIIKGYSEVIKPVNFYKPTKFDNDYYDENPFDHFNGSDEAEQVLLNNGWTLYKKQTNQFFWFTHPDSKSGGIHASFNKQKRVYYIFTSSSKFDSAKGYNPSTALCILQHGGDKKETFKFLVSQGFGKINPSREKLIAKKSATNNKPLPANASDAAIILHAAISAKLKVDHPYGVFWYDDYEKGILIDRQAVYDVSDKLGFMLFNGMLIRVVDRIIFNQQDRDYYDALKDYIKEDDADIYKRIINSYEPFIEKHGKFTITRLPILLSTQILSDTPTESYKPYLNCVVKITANNIEQIAFEKYDKFIWDNLIQKRDFNPKETGRYIDFLKNAIGIDHYLYCCIGYLSHQYKDESSPYIIPLTERCENPEDGGGAGKNVFCKLFEHTTTFSSRSGEQVSYDAKFLQSWNGEKVFCISDPPENFRWGFLKDLASNDALVKKLFKDERVVKCEDMAKFIIPTNFAVNSKDPGVARRIRQIEFTDFFTKSGGVDVHYGCHFPKGWNNEDWNGYDFIIINSIQEFIKNGLKIPENNLSSGGWIKQFEQNWGPFITGFIKEYWTDFVRLVFISNEQFKNFKETYMNENDINFKYKPTSHRLNEALSEWGKNKGFKHNKDARDRTQMGEPRGHSFLPINPPF